MYIFKECHDTTDSKSQKILFVDLTIGFYDTIPRLLKEFNTGAVVHQATSHINLQNNNKTKGIYFSGAEGISLTFKCHLDAILGFNPGEFF